MHPSVESLLNHFDYAHLPPHLAAVSQRFHDLAHDMAEGRIVWGPEGEAVTMTGAELATGLRKLLEAKDCAVRAVLDAERHA